MPELPVKEVRLSELHLPELKRDEIVRALSEIRRPAIELPDSNAPAASFARASRRIDWSRLDPTAIDLGRAVAGVAAHRPDGPADHPLALDAGGRDARRHRAGRRGAAVQHRRPRACRAHGRRRPRPDRRPQRRAATLARHRGGRRSRPRRRDPAAIVDADGVEPAIAAAESEIETEVVRPG